ncbi:hypothetical protein FN846DRAFT_967576 [Sphaerosporella brunnea]|uniref:Uncharacterized protein n=1 Tax=Sphaerosporella brunnea TaxID=1250544 RepID=A0A5J5ELG8_9PEZI|nr:hypothetical protein FN846DRAFT_967576 [Sphaerosporella brunnea]
MVSKILLLTLLPGTNAFLLTGLDEHIARVERILNHALSHAAEHQDRIAGTLNHTLLSVFYLILLSALLVFALKEKPMLRATGGGAFFLCFLCVILAFSLQMGRLEPVVCGVLFAAFVDAKGRAFAEREQAQAQAKEE